MANAVWQGGTGSSGSDWNVANNWSTAVVPGGGDTVTVPSGAVSTPVLSGGAPTVASITVANGASLVFAETNPTITGDFTVNGGFGIDNRFLVDFGGSTLTVDGTLTATNSGAAFTIGNRAQTSPTAVIVGALANTGTIDIDGNPGGKNQTPVLAELIVGTGAGVGGQTGVLNGNYNLGIGVGGAGGPGDALLDFAGGGLISTIQNGTVQLTGPLSFIASGNATSSNSALAGPLTIAASGGLVLQAGASVTTQALTIAGTAAVDTGFLATGGSTLTANGLMNVSGSLTIGRSAMVGAGTTVAANAGLANSGSINLSGDVGGGFQGVLNVAGTAGFGTAGVLSGTVNLINNSLLDFASGGITSIDKTGNLFIDGTHAFLASGNATTSNSALTGLASDNGTFTLQDGAQLTTSTGLSIGNGTSFSFANVDNSGTGGSTFHIGGALTINGFGSLTVGNNSITSATNVTAAALDFAGTTNASINVNGGKQQSGAAQSRLTVASAAGFGQVGVLAGGGLNLSGMALLDFTGGGQISSTAFGADITIDGTGAFVAAGNATSSNSALTGLTTVGGGLSLHNGASIAPTGNLAIGDGSHGTGILVDSGSTLAVGGTLSTVAFNDGLTVTSASVSAAAVSNVGGISVNNGGTLAVAGTFAQSAGNTTISGALNAPNINVTGGNLIFSTALNNSSTGTINLSGDGTTVEFAGAVAAGQTVNFTAPSGIVVLDSASSFSGTIAGMTAGISTTTPTSIIDLSGIANGNITGASLNTANDQLSVTLDGGNNLTIQLAGNYGAGTVVNRIADNSGNGTDLFLSRQSPSFPGNDFNGDGTSDILWRHSSGTVADWTVSNAQVQQSFGVGAAANNWNIVGTGDFDGDGTSDLLWHDSNSGTVAIWEMQNGQVKASLGVGAASSNWHIVTTGDFDGDGKSDFLWRDANTGTLALWEMNGAQVTASLGIGSVGSDWTVFGAGDFNGDGKSDILWRNTTSGTVALWEMNGAQVQSSVGLGDVGLNWNIQGIGDFNGDGSSDILWQDSNSGTIAIWEINNGQVTASLGVGSVASNWQIVGTGDYNHDGKSDILFRDSNTGTVAVWEMNGGNVAASVGLGAASSDWSIVHPNPLMAMSI